MHGSTDSGPMLNAKAARASSLPVCVTATLVYGLVLARLGATPFLGVPTQ
nr:hypothetical protein [Mycobacterium lepromatosis]